MGSVRFLWVIGTPEGELRLKGLAGTLRKAVWERAPGFVTVYGLASALSFRRIRWLEYLKFS